MKHFLLSTLILSGLFFLASDIKATTYQETVEKINYTHSVQLGSETPFYAPKDIGSSNPKLQVYMWADLHNLYTQQFLSSTFPSLLEKYGDVAQFSYYHHSLTWENPSMTSGIMGECAALQGHFWENVPQIMNEKTGSGESLTGLDQAAFKDCLADPKIKRIVETSNKEAESLGMKGVPTFVIENLEEPSEYDLKISGSQSPEIFDQAFQEALNGEQAADQEVEAIKRQIVDLETAIKNTQQKVEVVEAEQSRLSQELQRIQRVVQSILQRLRGIFGLGQTTE